MKFYCHFKTPDVLYYALHHQDIGDYDERKEAKAFADQWIEYGECVCIEFDTEAGTATVQKK